MKTAISPASPPSRETRIVGLGASAGGLEALELFLRHVPADSGLGFVIVQHMDPERKGMLTEILQRATPMPVVEVTDGVFVEPDHVYVIAPNTDLSIFQGALHSLPPAKQNKLHLPIDFFFRALAEDQQERAIGVVLSGMGEDGTHGLRAIQENDGLTFAQDPLSAKFDSMPCAAIDSGVIDDVGKPEELPSLIIERATRLSLAPEKRELAEKDRIALEKVFVLLRAQTGHDFSLYKHTTIYRRIRRRMGLHRLSSPDDYVRYLRENPQEAELLFKELLIGVTTFFRDPEAWNQLKGELVTRIGEAGEEGRTFRAWSAGCSTGEEALTLAMTFREALDEVNPPARCSLHVFATDLDKDAIDKARRGIYPAAIAQDVSAERLARFFVRCDDGSFRVKKEIRETVVFAPHNLAMHPPFTKLDLVVCRNLLIYLDSALQKKIMPLFHFALNPEGLLLLGSSETAGPDIDLFAPLPGKSRLYQRLPNSRPLELAGFPFGLRSGHPEKPRASSEAVAAPSLQSLADQLLLSQFSPAAVLVTGDGDIVYISGKTGQYLEPAAGRANWNIFAMCHKGLDSALSEAFHKAVRENTSVTREGIDVASGPSTHVVNVTVQPITEPSGLKGLLMVVFQNTLKPAEKQDLSPGDPTSMAHARTAELVEQLRRAHEEMQSTREEMQTSQEELRSANEELQSLNEELQSTNEELTTSAEEAQAMNEEMQVVNQEMQLKLEELGRASDDMKNLLDSVEIAIVFLDAELRVRRFTPSVVSIIKLIPTDVGRPITDLVTVLDYPDLAADARAVLKTMVPLEKQVHSNDNRWFELRILPYRTADERVDGTVLTLLDITATKNLESVLRRSSREAEAPKRDNGGSTT